MPKPWMPQVLPFLLELVETSSNVAILKGSFASLAVLFL